MSDTSCRLFVYGELLKPDVLAAQLGRIPPAEPAVLPGYRRELSPETGYYRAVRCDGARIVGLLLDELDEGDLDLLDRYENVAGGEYERLRVEVSAVDSSRESRAWVYAGVTPGAP